MEEEEEEKEKVEDKLHRVVVGNDIDESVTSLGEELGFQ